VLYSTQKGIHSRTLVPVVFFQGSGRARTVEPHFTDSGNGIFFAHWLGVRFCPKLCRLIKFLSIRCIHFGHLGILRIPRFWGTHQRLKRQQRRLDGKCWAPLPQTNSSTALYCHVPDKSLPSETKCWDATPWSQTSSWGVQMDIALGSEYQLQIIHLRSMFQQVLVSCPSIGGDYPH
jgi:hypothetical protein